MLGALKSLGGQFTSTLVDARRHLAAGAVARGVSIFLLYPLDTLKTRMQLPALARAKLHPPSIPVLFHGVFGSLAGQIPYGMLTFGMYEVYKTKLLAAYPYINVGFIHFAAAIMGDLTGSFWLCPSEVVKQQIQGGMHGSTSAALDSILRTSGVAGLYR
jgi:solute carrier family 25 S-adenosylmethionine transporter 26